MKNKREKKKRTPLVFSVLLEMKTPGKPEETHKGMHINITLRCMERES